MKARQSSDAICRVVFFSALFLIAVITGAAAEKRALLTGKAAMGDWTSDAPGVTRKITVQDLPPPSSNVLAIAFHGSWNRMKRTGYKVVRAPFDKSTGKARGEY
jgi:glucose/arabinose dehydrogenase